MHYLIAAAILTGLFLASRTTAFARYCDSVNRLATRQRAVRDGEVCSRYQPPTAPENSGLCAHCGMTDYKHRRTTRA